MLQLAMIKDHLTCTIPAGRLSARHRDAAIDNLVSGLPHQLRHYKHRYNFSDVFD